MFILRNDVVPSLTRWYFVDGNIKYILINAGLKLTYN
jgi:hypothetical protein